jgi:hypothetical protein
MTWIGRVWQGHFGAMVAVTANLTAGQGGAGSGRARQGLARFISHSIGDSET